MATVSREQKRLSEAWTISGGGQKVHEGANPTNVCTPGAIREGSDFSLESFVYVPAIYDWVNGGYKERGLVLYGDGEVGKTSMCKALCAYLGTKYIFTNSLDELRHAFVPKVRKRKLSTQTGPERREG